MATSTHTTRNTRPARVSFTRGGAARAGKTTKPKRVPAAAKERQTGWAIRPRGLAGRADAFAFVVEGNCMAPHYRNGDLAYAEPREPAPGDVAIVELKEWVNGHPRRFIKRLIDVGADIVICAQYNPWARLEIERARVARLYRVIPDYELWPRSTEITGFGDHDQDAVTPTLLARALSKGGR